MLYPITQFLHWYLRRGNSSDPMSSSAITIKYLHSYSVEVTVWVLQGNSGATSKEKLCFFCVSNGAVTV